MKSIETNYTSTKTNLMEYVSNTKRWMAAKLAKNESDANLGEKHTLSSVSLPSPKKSPSLRKNPTVSNHGICLDNNFYLTSIRDDSEDEYSNNIKHEENYSLSSKWMRRTLKATTTTASNVVVEKTAEPKKSIKSTLDEIKEVNANQMSLTEISEQSSDYYQVPNSSDPKHKSPILKNKDTKAPKTQVDKPGESKTSTITHVSTSLLVNPSIDSSSLVTISSNNELTSSSSSSESQCYYPRSSVNVFNVSHMLYDIPEEDDPTVSGDADDEGTENDASRHLDGVLKI